MQRIRPICARRRDFRCAAAGGGAHCCGAAHRAGGGRGGPGAAAGTRGAAERQGAGAGREHRGARTRQVRGRAPARGAAGWRLCGAAQSRREPAGASGAPGRPGPDPGGASRARAGASACASPAGPGLQEHRAAGPRRAQSAPDPGRTVGLGRGAGGELPRGAHSSGVAYRGPPPEGPGRGGEMNGFSTEEDSREGPPAAPAAAPGYGQSCCLIADGERCVRPAGNASFSKRVQKSISQKKLKLDIDKSVSLGAQRRAAGRDPGDARCAGPRRAVCAEQGTGDRGGRSVLRDACPHPRGWTGGPRRAWHTLPAWESDSSLQLSLLRGIVEQREVGYFCKNWG